MKALPTLKQMRHFVAVADHGHFGRAAAKCFVTQSTLSASVKELESVLGSILIERTKRSVKITPLGEKVAARARQVLREVEDIVDLVATAGEPLSGDLRLGVIPTIGPFLVPRVMPSLRDAYPSLKLYLREDQTSRLLDRLAAGDLDVVLLALPYRTEGMKTLVIADDLFFVACPGGHPFEKLERVTADDLMGEDLLLLEEGHCLRDHALSACHLEPGDTGVHGFQATSLHTLVQMVDSGLGLTLLPKMAIDAGVLRGTRIMVRPLVGPGVSRRIGLAWRRSSIREGDFALLGNLFKNELETPVTTKGRRDR